MILLLWSIAQASAPVIQTPTAPPPIVISPPIAPPAPPARRPPMPSFDQMSDSGRALVKAYDAKVSERERADTVTRLDLTEGWRRALTAKPFDARALRKAGEGLDSILAKPGVFTGWADLIAKLSESDRAILAPRLRSGSGRVYLNPPSPPTIVLPSAQEAARRSLLNRGMATLFEKIDLNRDPARLKARKDLSDRLRAETAAAMRRQPFDPAAAKAAFRRSQAARLEDEARMHSDIVDALSSLPADQREAVINAMWPDPSVHPVPMIPRIAPAPPAPPAK